MAGLTRPLPECIGRYRILSRIGAGGMGEVYQAHDPDIDRTVAIKTLPREQADDALHARLRREAIACGRVAHPRIVTIYDIGTHEGVNFIAMEYLAGKSLAKVMRGGPVPVPAALGIVTQILEALEFAHAQGVIHRDIKPSNVQVLPDGNIKLLDFGIAHVASAERLTSTGALFGTLCYMSPEQLEGRHVDARSDLFSTGALAYELFSGQRLFDGDTPSALVSQILCKAIPDVHIPGGVPCPSLDVAVGRALERSPADRYQSAADMREAFAQISSAPQVTAPAPTERTLPPIVLQPARSAGGSVADGEAADIAAATDRVSAPSVPSQVSPAPAVTVLVPRAARPRLPTATPSVEDVADPTVPKAVASAGGVVVDGGMSTAIAAADQSPTAGPPPPVMPEPAIRIAPGERWAHAVIPAPSGHDGVDPTLRRTDASAGDAAIGGGVSATPASTAQRSRPGTPAPPPLEPTVRLARVRSSTGASLLSHRVVSALVVIVVFSVVALFAAQRGLAPSRETRTENLVAPTVTESSPPATPIPLLQKGDADVPSAPERRSAVDASAMTQVAREPTSDLAGRDAAAPQRRGIALSAEMDPQLRTALAVALAERNMPLASAESARLEVNARGDVAIGPAGFSGTSATTAVFTGVFETFNRVTGIREPRRLEGRALEFNETTARAKALDAAAAQMAEAIASAHEQ